MRGDQADNCQTLEVTLYETTGCTGMELEIGGGGGISSKRWTDLSDCDVYHGAPTNGGERNCAAVKVTGYSGQDRNYQY
jgi:hypothetical protein